MKTKISISSVVTSGSNVVANNKKVLSEISQECKSFNYIVKISGRDYWAKLQPILQSIGYNWKSAKEFTVKSVLSVVPEQLHKETDKGKVLATFQNVYKYEQLPIMRKAKNGKYLQAMKNGKPLFTKIAVLDENKKKVIIGHELQAVNTWTISKLVNLLAQSKAITDGKTFERVKVAKKATKESKATKQTAKVKKAKLNATSAAPTTK